MDRDTAFEMATSNIRVGAGTTMEVGMDLKDMGVDRALVLTDPYLAQLSPVHRLLESLDAEGIVFQLYDQVHVEPTDGSFKEAISIATEGGFDGFVAIGGGSTMDTAKAANLYSTYPADFLDYVNPPIGKGNPVPGPLKPLVAIPTTTGTGSETTGVAIFDFEELHAKTGIAHRRLKPTLGVLDPEILHELPAAVAASTGLDVLSHALESYTALPFDQRPRPERPVLRPAYQGSNPISDLWALEALRIVAKYLPRVFRDADDVEAKTSMLMAASFAGIGFGNAGVHLPHGMSYPVASMVTSFLPSGYPTNYPLVPHGIAVIVNAPAVFRFTASACPERHLQAAAVLGASIEGASLSDAGKILADRLIEMMREMEMPNGLGDLGYGSEHLPALVQGTLPQHRVTKLAPRAAAEEDLTGLFEDAMSYW